MLSFVVKPFVFTKFIPINFLYWSLYKGCVAFHKRLLFKNITCWLQWSFSITKTCASRMVRFIILCDMCSHTCLIIKCISHNLFMQFWLYNISYFIWFFRWWGSWKREWWFSLNFYNYLPNNQIFLNCITKLSFWLFILVKNKTINNIFVFKWLKKIHILNSNFWKNILLKKKRFY